LTGFAFTNPQHMVNGPLYGPDNWIYVAHQGPVHIVVFQDPFGDRGSDIRFADGQGPQLKMAPRSVRFRPETHQLEFLSGCSQYGRLLTSGDATSPSRMTVMDDMKSSRRATCSGIPLSYCPASNKTFP